MAKAPTSTAKGAQPADAEPKHEGGVPVIALLVLTVLGGGAGALFGLGVPSMLPGESVKVAEERAHTKDDTILVPLAPITTNLAGNTRTWIRIEASVKMPALIGEAAQPLATKMTEDLVNFLRTLTPEQLEGPSGFQHLVEDLNDRVRLRSEGQVSEVLIQSLIVE